MTGFYGCMNRRQWTFLAMALVICAARGFAQECVVGWDPVQVGAPPDEDMYAVMVAGPICGSVIGVLRALTQSRENTEPALNLVRFS